MVCMYVYKSIYILGARRIGRTSLTSKESAATLTKKIPAACVCVRVCMCVCVWVCIHAYIHMYTCMCMCMNESIPIYICLELSRSISIYLSVYLFIYSVLHLAHLQRRRPINSSTHGSRQSVPPRPRKLCGYCQSAVPSRAGKRCAMNARYHSAAPRCQKRA